MFLSSKADKEPQIRKEAEQDLELRILQCSFQSKSGEQCQWLP